MISGLLSLIGAEITKKKLLKSEFYRKYRTAPNESYERVSHLLSQHKCIEQKDNVPFIMGEFNKKFTLSTRRGAFRRACLEIDWWTDKIPAYLNCVPTNEVEARNPLFVFLRCFMSSDRCELFIFEMKYSSLAPIHSMRSEIGIEMEILFFINILHLINLWFLISGVNLVESSWLFQICFMNWGFIPCSWKSLSE